MADHERESQLISGFSKLRLGQRREEVRAALGPPDTAAPLYGKEPNAPFQGWAYKYNIKLRAGGPNTNDICINVLFNPAGKLKWAVPNHIAGLNEVGPGGR